MNEIGEEPCGSEGNHSKKPAESKEELLERLLQDKIGGKLNEIEKSNDQQKEILNQWQNEIDELRADGNHFEMVVRLTEEGRNKPVFRNGLLAKKGLTKIGSSRDFVKMSVFALKNASIHQLSELDKSLISSPMQIPSGSESVTISKSSTSLTNKAVPSLALKGGLVSLNSAVGKALSPRNHESQIISKMETRKMAPKWKSNEILIVNVGRADLKLSQSLSKSILLSSPRSVLVSPRINDNKPVTTLEDETHDQEFSRKFSALNPIGVSKIQKLPSRPSALTKTKPQRTDLSKTSEKLSAGEKKKAGDRKIPQRETKKSPAIVGKEAKAARALKEKSEQTGSILEIGKGDSIQSITTKEVDPGDAVTINGDTATLSIQPSEQEGRSTVEL